MAPSNMNDASLVNAIARDRDQAALEALYDRYSRLVFSIAVQLLGDQRLAEEATLDVFTQIWQKADSYKPDRASVKTWIATISRYRAIDMLRRQKARPQATSITLDELGHQLRSRNPDPEEATERSLAAEQVRSALQELPDEQWQVLKLSYYFGYTQRRIAQELDIPLGTVKTRVRLAMEKLERRLNK